MNYIIDIEIEDRSLEDLGVETKTTLTPLHFDGKLLGAFWADPDGEFVKFYLKGITAGAFCCKPSRQNIDLLKKIHAENNLV